jgi:hypothetical protein
MATPSYKITFDKQDAADDIYENVIKLELEEDICKAANCMLRISIEQQDNGEWSYLDDDRFRIFTEIGISVGMDDNNAVPVFSGYITQLAPHFDPNESLCYLEVRGMDATCLMNLEEKLVTWVDKSHADIANEIFNIYGLTPDVADAPATHVQDGNVLVQRSTDIRFLKELAKRNGFDCYVTVDDSGDVKGCFKANDLGVSPLPPLAVAFEGETNVQFIDLQVTGNQGLSMAGWQLNLEDKSLDQVVSDKYTETLLGSESLIDISKDRADSLSSPSEAAARMYKGDAFLDSTELENSLQGSQDRHCWFIKAKGTVNGEQYSTAIRARSLVPVKGLGTIYSGNYLVSSVRHVFSGGEYIQNFELLRNARGLSGNESFEGEQ